MEAAISVLEQELKWSKEHKSECPQNKDYYEGWIESLKASIALLGKCKMEKEIKANRLSLSPHDKTVYEVAVKQLQQGARWIDIGAHIDGAKDIIEKLKTRFPEADIRLYR